MTAWFHAVVSVRLRANQIISGINLLALGVTNYLVTRLFGELYCQSRCIPTWNVPLLSRITFLSLGSILFQQNVLTYVALAVVLLVQVALFNTTWDCDSDRLVRALVRPTRPVSTSSGSATWR